MNAPSHALMLLAPDGSGKRSVAEALARGLLELEDATRLQEHAHVIYVETKDKSIPIDDVRALQKRLQLKTIGTRPIRRVVLIEAAHRLTTEAQNALLKILEEPPADTVFILTVTSKHSVLPTIYSRSQHIELKAPALSDITDHLKTAGHSDADIQSALRYSGGRLGLSYALLNKDQDHPLLTAVSRAREVLSKPLFERLSLVDEWAQQKDELSERLDTLERLCQAGLAQAASTANNSLTKRWQRYYQAVYDTKASLHYTPNTKLLLSNLFLRLS